MPNYTSFTGSSLPQMPVGATAGVLSAQRDAMMRQAQQATLEQMLLERQRQQAENDRYTAETPSKVAGFESERLTQQTRQNTPGYFEQAARGDMGKAATSEATGATDRNDMLLSGIPLMDQAASSGPINAQLMWDNLRSQLPKEVQGMLPKAWTPQTRKMYPEVMQSYMKEQNTKAHDLRERETRYGVESLREKMRLQQVQAKTKTLEQELQGAKTLDHQIAVALNIEQDSNANDELKRKARSIAFSALTQQAAKIGVRMPPPLPGLPMPPVNVLLEQLKDAALRQQSGRGSQIGTPAPAEIPQVAPGTESPKLPDTNTGIPGVTRLP